MKKANRQNVAVKYAKKTKIITLQNSARLTIFSEHAHAEVSSDQLNAHDLFASFTANILKENTVFTR